jgi:hypothetical protein
MQQDMLSFTDEDYYHNAIIRPPKDMTFLDNNTRYTRIVVDSRVRNKNLFPNPNDYEVQLDDDVNDVKSARLIIMELSMPMYLINTNFRNIYFKIGTTEYVAQIEIGDYSATDLATAITTAMNAQVASTFLVTYDSKLDNFNINSTVAFTLQFINKTNTLDQLLGFSSLKDYTSSSDPSTPSYPNRVKSEFRKNFEYNNFTQMRMTMGMTLRNLVAELEEDEEEENSLDE